MSGSYSMARRRVLVTGASGFIGRHVITALCERGNDIVVLQNRNNLLPAVRTKCSDVILGDICDHNIQQQVVRGIDAICHLAAYIPDNLDDASEADKCYRVNALATLGLAAAAVKEGVKRFVYFSTGNFYGPSDQKVAEDGFVFPSEKATYYFTSKLMGEIYLAHLCGHSATDLVTLRIGSTYGPGEAEKKVVATFMRQAVQRETLKVLHGGKTKYNFVYVEDVARCVALAIESGSPGVYNFASGEHTSLLTLAEAIALVCGEPKAAIIVEPAADNFPVGFAPLSVEKACKTWQCTPLGLVEGLRRYRHSLENKGD